MVVWELIEQLQQLDPRAEVYLSNSHATNMPHPGALDAVEFGTWSTDRNEPVAEEFRLPGESTCPAVILWGSDMAGLLPVPGTA
jgi:hypothetical protein